MLNLNLKAENELTGKEGRMFQAVETAVKRSWGTSQNTEGNWLGDGIKVVRTGAAERQGSDQASPSAVC